ncbi:MAG: CDP-alcohol phosphatidyltransferase family protein [Xanthomarina sp.]
MSKLPKEHKFIDLSDYGRAPARFIANAIKHTSFTPIHVTISFIISGVIAIICILNKYFLGACFFLILKSVLDAADGELARIKNTPSYTGRYFDSVSDIIINFLIFMTLWFITDSNLFLAILAFLGVQLQGTLYNYYYTILRNNFNGDTTSRIFETEVPIALEEENQKNVNFFFKLYKILYGGFDRIIYTLDRPAAESRNFPNWLMTAVSTFGLGFQLLLIGILLIAGFKESIIPFFIIYTLMVFVFIGIRRLL